MKIFIYLFVVLFSTKSITNNQTEYRTLALRIKYDLRARTISNKWRTHINSGIG